MSEHVLLPARRETRDVGFAPMLIAGLLMLVALGSISLFVLWLYPRSTYDKQFGQSAPKFPETVLQPNTALDMQHFYAEEMKALNGVGGWTRRRESSTSRSPTPCATWRGPASRTGPPRRGGPSDEPVLAAERLGPRGRDR